jgi:hypothetical protein
MSRQESGSAEIRENFSQIGTSATSRDNFDDVRLASLTINPNDQRQLGTALEQAGVLPGLDIAQIQFQPLQQPAQPGQLIPAQGPFRQNPFNPIPEKDIKLVADAILNTLGAPGANEREDIAQVLGGALSSGGQQRLGLYIQAINGRLAETGLTISQGIVDGQTLCIPGQQFRPLGPVIPLGVEPPPQPLPAGPANIQ